MGSVPQKRTLEALSLLEATHLLNNLLADLQKRDDDLGGELPTLLPFDFGEGKLSGVALAVWRLKDHRVKSIGHRHNAGQAGDLFSLEAVGVAVPVPTFVMRTHDRQRREQVGY